MYRCIDADVQHLERAARNRPNRPLDRRVGTGVRRVVFWVVGLGRAPFEMARPGLEPGTPRFSEGRQSPWDDHDLQDFFW